MFDFLFINTNKTKVLKLTVKKTGVERLLTDNDLEFAVILEELILQAIPISFIPVFLEIISTFILAWILYPIVINFIDSKND